MSDGLKWYEEQWEKYASKKFDNQLSNIKGLTWLPWVGNKYEHSRIIIIAESHYVRANSNASAEDSKKQWTDDKCSTREVVAEYPLYGYQAGWVRKDARGIERNNNPTFDNLARMLTGSALLCENEQPLRGCLWSKLAYMNLIQRPMWLDQPGGSERPSDEDRATGWQCVIQVLDILKPTLCIVAGIEASRYFNTTMNSLGKQARPLLMLDRIGRCSPRRSKICLQNGAETDVAFIQHPGKYFAWERWRGFMFNSFPESLKTLSTSIS